MLPLPMFPFRQYIIRYIITYTFQTLSGQLVIHHRHCRKYYIHRKQFDLFCRNGYYLVTMINSKEKSCQNNWHPPSAVKIRVFSSIFILTETVTLAIIWVEVTLIQMSYSLTNMSPGFLFTVHLYLDKTLNGLFICRTRWKLHKILPLSKLNLTCCIKSPFSPLPVYVSV